MDAPTLQKVDWATARMTPSAQNANKPENRFGVIAVPRKVFPVYWAKPFDEVEDAAARRVDGVEPIVAYGIDVAPTGFAYLRAAERSEKSLLGKALLYSQGWGKA